VVWQGGLYVRQIEHSPQQLRLEFQSYEPVNAVFLNGHFLGYLPVKDWTYSWVSTKFSVPSDFLQLGYNQLTIRAGHVAPKLQGPGFVWDEVLFRGICLERASSDSSAVKFLSQD
jgi:hypothetical protein